LFTATKDKLLPTTVTGSRPRPSWYHNNTNGERFSICMTDSAFRQQFQDDATSVVISDQERAGLDILTNGDYHLDPETAGRSWLHFPLDRIDGLSADEYLPPSEQLYEYPRGTLLNEILTNAWMWPKAVEKISLSKPMDFDRIWEVAQSKTTDRPVKFGSISAQTLADFVRAGADVYWTSAHWCRTWPNCSTGNCGGSLRRAAPSSRSKSPPSTLPHLAKHRESGRVKSHWAW
jgi:5-methyltetrahydropteroyltriglutamate--homocysteine methyltransferase